MVHQGEEASKEAATKELAEIMIKAKEEAEKQEAAEAAAAAAAVQSDESTAAETAEVATEAAVAQEDGAAEAKEAAAETSATADGELPETLKKSQVGRKKEEEVCCSTWHDSLSSRAVCAGIETAFHICMHVDTREPSKMEEWQGIALKGNGYQT